MLFLIGAVAMRGAGCTFNDIVDTDIDMKVARTRSRPIPSGQVTQAAGAGFLVAQGLVGLLVLMPVQRLTIVLGVASLVLVAIYPFMKRITWWPQLFLGLAFNWGALMGWSSQTGSARRCRRSLLYVGAILWTIGYDTIYALQDVEDDALIGVKSTARLFGRRTPAARRPVLCGDGGDLGGGAAAGASWVAFSGLVVVALMFGWQVWTLHPNEPSNALIRFRSNHWVGLALTLPLIAGRADSGMLTARFENFSGEVAVVVTAQEDARVNDIITALRSARQAVTASFFTYVGDIRGRWHRRKPCQLS